VIQGDISKCFDRIPHDIIIKLIQNKIRCPQTLQLVKKSLKAGYIDPETGKKVIPDMGTPQGSVLSPLLANIVLHQLDVLMEKQEAQFYKGKTRARNRLYSSLTSKIQNAPKYHPDSTLIKKLVIQRHSIPSMKAIDPNLKRLAYYRYADDFIVLITGSRDDAVLIKQRIKSFLKKECGLELSEEKTLISRTRDGFLFLGAKCKNLPQSQFPYLVPNKSGTQTKPRLRMRILAPIANILDRLIANGFAYRDDKGMPQATARKDLVNLSHFEILRFYNHRITGILNFYSFAGNYNDLRKIMLFLQLSCALTLALKHKERTKNRVFKRFGRLLTDPDTGESLRIPDNFKVKHQYQKSNGTQPNP
jgi:hypothetical protein